MKFMLNILDLKEIQNLFIFHEKKDKNLKVLKSFKNKNFLTVGELRNRLEINLD